MFLLVFTHKQSDGLPLSFFCCCCCCWYARTPFCYLFNQTHDTVSSMWVGGGGILFLLPTATVIVVTVQSCFRYRLTSLVYCVVRQKRAASGHGGPVQEQHGSRESPQLPPRLRPQRGNVHLHDTKPRPLRPRSLHGHRLGHRLGERGQSECTLCMEWFQKGCELSLVVFTKNARKLLPVL